MNNASVLVSCIHDIVQGFFSRFIPIFKCIGGQEGNLGILS